MNLSSDLVSQFVKMTKDDNKTKPETTVNGTIVEYKGANYVQLDGSEAFTPYTSSAVVKPGERVTVLIKNHTATVTGNISSPSASSSDVDVLAGDTQAMGAKILEFGSAIGDKASISELAAERARIDGLVAADATITGELDAYKADITKLKADQVTVTGKLEADEAEIEQLKTSKLDADVANTTFATIKDLEATDADVHNLSATYATFSKTTTDKFEAIDAEIESLEAGNIDVEALSAKFANIDFSNIGTAAIEYFYAKSGLIENATMENGTITGVLVGVTIKGDLIEGGTVVADKLVIRGEDGLYYKLNTDGVTTEAEQTEYNSINGSIITAKSITATKISVSDLVAFGATIGGFNITNDSLYSGVKESVDNATRGIFMDKEGQLSLGDADNYLRYFKDENGDWKLQISAESILFGKDAKSSAEDIKALTEHVKIGTYTNPDTGDTQPCVELSEGDSNFKQVITNSGTMFMDGSIPRTEIDPNGIASENITVKNELRQGGFMWKYRSNGHLSLMVYKNDHRHQYTTLNRTNPTCDTDGSVTYHCSGCGDTYERVLYATGHVERINSNYNDDVNHEYICSSCGKHMRYEEHNGVYVYTNFPECGLSDGYDVYRCSVCGKDYRTNYVEVGGSEHTDITYSFSGNYGSHTATCGVCGVSWDEDCTPDDFGTCIYCGESVL